MNYLVSILAFLSICYSQCLGDINDDYTINVQDVVIMTNTILDDNEIYYYVADINNDGNIDVLDIISLMNIILYENSPCSPPIDIIYNIHESLPIDWIVEFHLIMDNLTNIIPANQNYFDDLNIYAWNSNVEDPYPGIQGGTYIGGSDQGFYMVLEINEMEFEWNHMHRYSVIAHEYFHVYQLSINEPMNEPNGGYNPNGFSIKWLIEGTATAFESIYIQDYYNYNYFTNELAYTNISNFIHTDPSIFESYDSNNMDMNYTSSVFMVLVLAKELIELGHSENDAFEMIFKEFMLTGAKNSNWENFFLDIFGFSVNDFYDILQSYTLNLEDVIPSSSLSLQQIFD